MSIQGTNLSIRMATVAETLLPCRKCLDVGCDHGYVSIALVSGGTAEKALCLDINKGPLTAAEDNIRNAGLEDRIETRLSNGLHNVTTSDDADAVIIAGMGGNLMAGILKDGAAVLSGVKQMVLQPQSELFLVRAAIDELGFHIDHEKFIKDRDKYYYVMDVRPGKGECFEDAEFYLNFPKSLLESKDELYREYLLNSLSVCEGYLKNIKPGTETDLYDKVKDLKKAIDIMDGK